MMISDVLVMIVFGFPAMFVSLLVSVIGILQQKYWLVIIGAVLIVPFSYYLSGAPGLARLPILVPGFHVGSALALREKNKLWAWLLLLPSFFAVLWVVGVALYYQFQ